MRITLKQVYTFLFLLGIFFIPFNSYNGISFLGEFKRDGAIIFFLLSFFFLLLDSFYKGRIKFSKNNLLFHFLILFIVWLFISTFLNSISVYTNYIKTISGFNRFIRQIISLVISIIIFITALNIVFYYPLKTIFKIIRKIFFYSFLVVSFYGVIELLVVYFNVLFLKPILLLFNYFPFINVYLDFNGARISSISYEPPFLAIYLITIASWMFSYILTSKRIIKYIPTLFVFILTFFSGSRTALIVILVQFVLFIWIAFSINKRFQKTIQRFLFLSATLVLLLFIFNGNKVFSAVETKISSLNFKENLTKSISNKSRFGIQYTSLLIFIEHPFTGVGFGQQAYHAKNKYPKWATHKNYEFNLYYLNDKVKSFPPGFNLYTRLLAETGIIGSLIFLSFIFLIFYSCKKLIKNRKDIEKVIPIVLLVSFVGFAINWLQFDSFRVFGFWICLALLIQQTQQKKMNNEKK